MTPAQLTAVHRRQQLALRRATIANLARLWPALDWARLDATYPAFAVQVAELVRLGRVTSNGLAASYVRAFKVASGLPPGLDVLTAPVLVEEQFAASLNATSIAALKTAAAAGTSEALAMRNGLTLAQGAVARLVLEAGRETVRATSIADPDCRGWERVGDGQSCEFCTMLLSRGAVYSEESAGFEAHDACGCTAAPSYTP